MKKLLGLLTAASLSIGLTACADPQAEFDMLITNAQVSIESEDFAMAEAYLADAKLLFPDSAVLSETENRLLRGRKSIEALSATLDASSSGDWRAAYENAQQIPATDKNFSTALASVEEAYQAALLEASLGSTDLNQQERLLVAQSDLESFGLQIDDDLVSSVYQLALNTRLLELSALLEAESFEAAIDSRDVVLGLSIYEIDDLASSFEQIESAFVDWSISETKKLTKNEDYSKASAANKEAMARVPGNELLAAESARIREANEAAAEAKRQAEEAAKRKALNAMFVKEDTFNGITWYHDRNTYSRYAGNKFLLYIGQRGNGTPWLRMRFMLYRDNWHFFERIVLNVDGSRYEFTPGYGDISRDNGGGDVWEWYDFSPTSSNLSMVRKIIDSNDARIRYINDDNVYVEKTVSSSQKKAFENVLLAFEALGGKP